MYLTNRGRFYPSALASICQLVVIFWSLQSFQAVAQETRWNGFMDVNANFSDRDKISSFDLGQLDIYVTSDITDRITFLTENTFTLTETGTFKPAVERAIIKYEVNNYLNFLIGKHHTPVSYWNNTYHHGRVLQPTSTRPLLFNYGLFPIHSIGLIVSGDYIGNKDFGYQLMIANGGGHYEGLKDNDKFKSASLTTHFYPVKDFKLSFSIYGDHLSKGSLNFKDSIIVNAVNQGLFNLALTYLPSGKKFEFISEVMFVNNHAAKSNYGNNGFYVYSGYHINKLTPYIRYDYIDTARDDPYFGMAKVNASTLGIRYSFSYISNIKVEWIHTDNKMNGNNNRFSFQFGIGF
jgi:hypothetical protein